MSKPVLFYGKPNQLDDVLTYCRVKNLVDGNTNEEEQSAGLASLFRGAALAWLTQQLQNDNDLLNDYDEFVARTRATFGLSEEAILAQASRKYANCYQKASVQLYALEFKQLSTRLGIPDITAVAQFHKGLKSHIREALVIRDQVGNLDAVIAEAQRIDSQLYSSKRTQGSKNKGHGGKSFPSTGSAGKCHTCGQFGHKAANCKVKREQTPW
jgi:ribosome-binding protein aMBF1 (putative translation factor)